MLGDVGAIRDLKMTQERPQNGSKLALEEPREAQDEPREVQDEPRKVQEDRGQSPKTTQKSTRKPPSDPKSGSKTLFVVFVFGLNSRSLSGPLFEVFLGCLTIKNSHFAQDVLQKRCFHQVAAKSEEDPTNTPKYTPKLS